MNNLSLFLRISRRIKQLPLTLIQSLRILKCKMLSDIKHLENHARVSQPTLMLGQGKIRLSKCSLGFWPSPFYLSGYIHIEARESTASIEIEDGVMVNNNAVIIAERTSIHIGANTMIGPEFYVVDSDFHDLHPERRTTGSHKCLPVYIGKNVFIGARVTILKGVTIGDDSVVAAGAVVVDDIPARSVSGGVPARVIGTI